MVYRISSESYCKIILHSHKYPSQQVCGILLGKDSKDVEITDSVPLFHGHIPAPLLEAALMQLDEHSKSKNLKIIGAYFANEHLENNNLSLICMQIGDKIKNETSAACILLVDNTQLTLTPKEIAVQLFTNKSKEWNKNLDKLELRDSDTLGLLKAYLSENKSWNLNDFDNHLDDCTKDWLNTSLL